MLSRANRLVLRTFPDFFKTAATLHTSGFLVWFRPATDPTTTQTQVAILVPKKNARLSVDRHTIKRRVGEAVRSVVSGELPLTPLQVVVMPKKIALGWSVRQFSIDLQRVWQAQ